MLITILEIISMEHNLPFQKTDYTPSTPSAFKKTHNRGHINLYLNDNSHIYAERGNTNHWFVNIDTTLKLVKNDKVHVRLSGCLSIAEIVHWENNASSTYFEGRMVARLDG